MGLCKECNKSRVKNWIKFNPEKRKKYYQKWKHSDLKKWSLINKKSALKTMYNLTLEEFNNLIKKQTLNV